jgi:hypothetical protein
LKLAACSSLIGELPSFKVDILILSKNSSRGFEEKIFFLKLAVRTDENRSKSALKVPVNFLNLIQ